MASPEQLEYLMEQTYALGRIIGQAARRPRTWGRVSLFGREIQAMRILFRQEGITQTDLCVRSCCTKSSGSAVVDRLEDKGLACRVRVGKKQTLHLTPLGRQICLAKRKENIRRVNEMAEHIPVELQDLEAANRVLEAVLEYLQNYPLPDGDPIYPFDSDVEEEG